MVELPKLGRVERGNRRVEYYFVSPRILLSGINICNKKCTKDQSVQR